MKKNIYLHLFVFALLLSIFLLVQAKNANEMYETKIKNFQTSEKQFQERIEKLEDENLDLLYFNLENNDDALDYFERDGYDTAELIPFLRDELYRLNEAKGEHPLIPYAAMSENGRMLINKVRFLNHKWIITDFSDGEFWGELLVTYEITADKELKFKLVDSFLYPPQN